MNCQQHKHLITGVALSPEFIYALGPDQMMPDPRRFGIVWAPRASLEATLDLEGAYSHLVLKLAPVPTRTGGSKSGRLYRALWRRRRFATQGPDIACLSGYRAEAVINDGQGSAADLPAGCGHARQHDAVPPDCPGARADRAVEGDRIFFARRGATLCSIISSSCFSSQSSACLIGMAAGT